MFVLPVLTYTQPSAVRSALQWRHSTLDSARERAETLNLRGAAFPWRTIEGPSRPDTGRPAPRPSTSPPTSPTPCAAT
ncbi:hypothetical protein NKG94_32415 [Micromonospora sp. M12]